MKRLVLLLLGGLFLLETLYYNLLFDYLLMSILFLLALSVGGIFSIKAHGIDTLLVKIALGLGMISCIVWLSTFNYVYGKYLLLLLATLLVLYRHSTILEDLKQLKNYLRVVSKTHTSLFVILILAMIFYMPFASYPIDQFDALAKHIVIPTKILTQGYYDYNVVESIVFGDYALLAHMLYLVLLSMGAAKALVLMNVLITFLTLTVILRLSSFLTKKHFPLIAISIIYLTTPLVFRYSTTLYLDVYPIFFIAVSLLLIQYDKMMFLIKNLPLIALLFGFAFFSKQVAFYMIIPIGIYLIFLLINGRQKIPSNFIYTLVFSLGLFFLPFLPVMLLIWYKTGNPVFPFINEIFQSPYFALSNFQDPFVVWKRYLGFDLQSLWTMVFHTSQNTEDIDGVLGLHLLLIPLALIISALLFKNKRYFGLIFLVLGSYWISVTFFNPNLRYFMGAILFAIPVVILALDRVLIKFKYDKLYSYTFFIVIIIMFSFNVCILFLQQNHFGFTTKKLIADSRLVLAPNQNILEKVNKSDVYLLSNNDQLRGAYKGHYYTLSWYNMMYMIDIYNHNKRIEEFFKNFDYYLVDKLNLLAPEIDYTKIEKIIEKIDEDERYVLYKINKSDTIILDHNLSKPTIVTVDTPKVEIFTRESRSYQIVIDASPSKQSHTIGRFQINWSNEKGDIRGVSLVPFDLNSTRAIYTSNVISDIPKDAVRGQLYISAHTSVPMTIYAYKLIGKKSILIEKKLEEYGQKLMPVYK